MSSRRLHLLPPGSKSGAGHSRSFLVDGTHRWLCGTLFSAGLQDLLHVRSLLDEYLGAAFLALDAHIVDVGPDGFPAVTAFIHNYSLSLSFANTCFLDLAAAVWG